MSSNIHPEPPAPAAAPPANPFESWAPVWGEDAASVNPYELRQRHDWVSALQDEESHGATLGKALADWQYLNPGETLDDFQAAMTAYRAGRENPFGAPPEPEYFEPGEAEVSYNDPNALRAVWKQDQQAMREEIERDLRNEWRSEQMARSLEGNMASIASQHSLDDEDRGEIWNAVQFQLSQGNLRPDQINTIVDDTYAAWDARNQARIAKALAAAGNTPTAASGAPVAPGPAGATPTATNPVTDARSLAKLSMERARQMDGE